MINVLAFTHGLRWQIFSVLCILSLWPGAGLADNENPLDLTGEVQKKIKSLYDEAESNYECAYLASGSENMELGMAAVEHLKVGAVAIRQSWDLGVGETMRAQQGADLLYQVGISAEWMIGTLQGREQILTRQQIDRECKLCSREERSQAHSSAYFDKNCRLLIK